MPENLSGVMKLDLFKQHAASPNKKKIHRPEITRLVYTTTIRLFSTLLIECRKLVLQKVYLSLYYEQSVVMCCNE